MLRDRLSALISSAVEALIASGRLPEDVRTVPVEISDTKQPEHGDYACNFAMAAAKKAGMNSRALGDLLQQALESKTEGGAALGRYGLISSVDVAGPGFLNIRLVPQAIATCTDEILELGADLAKIKTPKGPNAAVSQHINIEFVSVNPNGPITIGSGRGAAYGSALCNVLEAAGNHVHREYYINDGTNSEQMRQFALSVRCFCSFLVYGDWRELNDLNNWRVSSFSLLNRYMEHLGPNAPAGNQSLFDGWITYSKERELGDNNSATAQLVLSLTDDPIYRNNRPRQLRFVYEQCYLLGAFREFGDPLESLRYIGDYIFEIAKSLVAEDFDLVEKHLAIRDAEWFRHRSQEMMLSAQQDALNTFGVEYDTWFSEQSLHDSGEVARCVKQLEKTGAADAEPYRNVLKLARGGVIEGVERQHQTAQMEVEEDETGAPGDEPLDTAIASSEEDSVVGTAGVPPADIGNTADSTKNATNTDTLWLRSTKFADDMDRVLRRRDGRLTYIASDVAYHKNKFNRGSKPDANGKSEKADKLITILGPDHHGYIGRLTAVVAASLMEREDPSEPSELDPNQVSNEASRSKELSEIEAKIYKSPQERDAAQAALKEAKQKLEVQIYQLVRFLKDGKPAPMRKRDGNIYALIDLINEIGEKVKPNGSQEEKQTAGKDVARFFYLMRSHDTTFDFDLDLAQKQSDENPVFYVQYAHARIASVIRKAEGLGLTALGPYGVKENTNPATDMASTPQGQGTPQRLGAELLVHPKELALIKKILDLPWEVQRAAEDYGVHRLTTFAIELARAYHNFYDACRVIQPDEPVLTQARLALCRAAQIGLKATLDLLGISAPDRMDRNEMETSSESPNSSV